MVYNETKWTTVPTIGEPDMSPTTLTTNRSTHDYLNHRLIFYAFRMGRPPTTVTTLLHNPVQSARKRK